MNQSDLNMKHKQGGFAVPEGYFDQMKSEVMQKAYPGEKKIILLRSSFVKYAAIFLLGIFITSTWLYLDQTKNTSDWYADAVESELYTYEYAMLDEYTVAGNESDLTNSEDNYLINSEYGSEILMSDDE